MGEKTPLQGALFIWPGYWLLHGTALSNRRHRHVSASVLVGLDGPIRVEADGQWHEVEAAIVAPEQEQALDSGLSRTLIIHLDPDQPLWRHFHAVLEGAGYRSIRRSVLQLPVLQAAVDAADIDAVQRWFERVAEALCPDPAPLDARIRSVTDFLRDSLPEKIELSELSAVANLSGSRLTHLFKQQTGVTLRRFLAHLKIQRAVFSWRPGMQDRELRVLAETALLRDEKIIAIAEQLGFSDESAFAKAFRRWSGMTPSQFRDQ